MSYIPSQIGTFRIVSHTINSAPSTTTYLENSKPKNAITKATIVEDFRTHDYTHTFRFKMHYCFITMYAFVDNSNLCRWRQKNLITTSEN